MNFKKYSYLIVFLVMLLIGITTVDAARKRECYYMSSDKNFKGHLTLRWGFSDRLGKTLGDYTELSIEKIGHENWTQNDEGISNWWDTMYGDCVDGIDKKICFGTYYDSEKAANEAKSPKCPTYIVYGDCDWETVEVWGTESKSKAEKAVKAMKKEKCVAFYGSYKDESGNPISEEDYYSEFELNGILDLTNRKPTCDDYETIFGKKDDPESIRYMLDEILTYVRIIVPILIILLGTIDLSKAVLAGKEDNMRKAQADFIKRLLIGVAVFLVPTFIDIIMDLAEIVWDGDYIHCGF